MENKFDDGYEIYGQETKPKSGYQPMSYEEAVENYNDDVRWRIERLQKLIEEAKQDFIKQDKG